VQNGCDWQVFAANRAVDYTLQTFDGAERIDRTPVSARAVVILD
jgi:hypothetical protein